MLPRLLSLLLLLLSLPATAREPLVLDGRATSIDPRPHLAMLRDAGGALDLDAVRARDAEFVPLPGGRDLNLGYIRDAVWLRLTVRSALPRGSDWRFEIDYPSLDHAEWYEPLADGTHRHLRGGDALRFSERAMAHRNPVFPLHLAAGETRTVYLRAESEGSMTLIPRLWEAGAFQTHSEAGYAAQALYLGMLLALAAYNLLLFFALRDRAYLFYVAFVLSLGLGMTSLYGFGAQFLWPDWPAWNNRALPIGIALCGILAPLFTRDFLDTGERAPVWHRWLGAAAVLQAGVLLVSLLGSVQTAVQAMSAGGIVNCVLMLACGIACALRGLPGARLFVLAWLLLLLGGTLLAVRNFGLVPTNAVTLYSLQIGSALEMLLLSFALAARFNQLKREKEAAQAQALAAQAQTVITLQQQERILERKVAERTEELAAANARLRELALHDPLTGLANRAALYGHLDHALQRARRRGAPLALLMVDLDGFKAVNDRLGHEAGDRVLVEVADRLTASARGSDLVARLGGDEFVLVCEEIGEGEGAQPLAERALAALRRPIRIDGHEAGIGASIGIAVGGADPVDVGELLRRADQAMYAAKAAGRGAIRFAADQAQSTAGDAGATIDATLG